MPDDAETTWAGLYGAPADDLASPREGGRPRARDRGRMRRRLRQQRRMREALLLDLGALVYELHRQGRREPQLLQAKAAEVSAVDAEVRALTNALDDDDTVHELVAAGIAGSCDRCGALLSTDARFCAACGTPALEATEGVMRVGTRRSWGADGADSMNAGVSEPAPAEQPQRRIRPTLPRREPAPPREETEWREAETTAFAPAEEPQAPAPAEPWPGPGPAEPPLEPDPEPEPQPKPRRRWRSQKGAEPPAEPAVTAQAPPEPVAEPQETPPAGKSRFSWLAKREPEPQPEAGQQEWSRQPQEPEWAPQPPQPAAPQPAAEPQAEQQPPQAWAPPQQPAQPQQPAPSSWQQPVTPAQTPGGARSDVPAWFAGGKRAAAPTPAPAPTQQYTPAPPPQQHTPPAQPQAPPAQQYTPPPQQYPPPYSPTPPPPEAWRGPPPEKRGLGKLGRRLRRGRGED